MTLEELRNLDDRTYDDLMQEALSMIPTYALQWTNHNPSDPGITLIEMFAYLTEMLLYRQNRVTEANMLMFLKLLRGPNWEQKQDLQTEITETISEVRDRYRAITSADFVELALEADNTIARAHCLPRRNLYSENPLAEPGDKPGHVSIIIIPVSIKQVMIFALSLLISRGLYRLGLLLLQDYLQDSPPQPNQNLIDRVTDYLEQRRLITTKIHVVAPLYLTISVRLTIYLNRQAESAASRKEIEKALEYFFHPLPNPDNPQQLGWSFGRNVYVSEIYQLLDELAGVDYVTKTNQQDEVFFPNSNANLIARQRLIRTEEGELSAIALKPEELVNLKIAASEIEIISPLTSIDIDI